MMPQLARFISARLGVPLQLTHPTPHTHTHISDAQKVDPILLTPNTLAHDVMLYSHCFSVRSPAHHMFIGLNGENMLREHGGGKKKVNSPPNFCHEDKSNI